MKTGSSMGYTGQKWDYNRIYVNYTTDFMTVSDCEVFDPAMM